MPNRTAESNRRAWNIAELDRAASNIRLLGSFGTLLGTRQWRAWNTGKDSPNSPTNPQTIFCTSAVKISLLCCFVGPCPPLCMPRGEHYCALRAIRAKQALDT